VPSELGSLTGLTHLDLSDNPFTGTVPSELGYLTGLTHLDLSDNGFTGTVPLELGALTALETWYLNGNSLNGTVPAKLCNLRRTVIIQIDCNPGPQCSCCECCAAIVRAEASLLSMRRHGRGLCVCEWNLVLCLEMVCEFGLET
jgi:hypothetical protein